MTARTAANAPDESRLILSTLASLLEPLARLIAAPCEVVLHDLDRLPDSIVAVSGDLTGRRPGGPATDWLLRSGARGSYRTRLGYASTHPDGRTLMSSTIVVNDSGGRAVAALCVNSDPAVWRQLADLAAAMVPTHEPASPAPVGGADPAEGEPLEPASVVGTDAGSEQFPGDVDDLAASLLRHALSEVDVPIELMHKRHKLQVVQNLNEGGFFLIKESVERAAQTLGVSRFTIYNYLKEL